MLFDSAGNNLTEQGNDIHGYKIVYNKQQKVVKIPITDPLSDALKMATYY